MSIHPEGLNTTQRLLDLAAVPVGSRILDLGAGDGESVRYLQKQGLAVVGVDRNPGPDVMAGDMQQLPMQAGSFDCLLAECSLSVCGNTARAVAEARRVLKPGGLFMVSDVYYRQQKRAECLSLPFPASREGWEKTMKGFQLLAFEDISEAWLQFLVDSVWNRRSLGDCGFYQKAAGKGCGYFLAVWKEDTRYAMRRTYHGRRIVLTHGKL